MGTSPAEAEYEELRAVAERVALEAAALVRDRRRAGVEVTAQKSSAVDVVTKVDQESEQLLRERLAELRPGDGFFGEEGGRAGSDSGVTWVVDPIDGTVNFLYGIAQYAVSVAAVDDADRALAGVVVDVAHGDVFSAARGSGATKNGVAIRVREPGPMAEQLFLTGFAYQASVRQVQGAAVARLVSEVRDIRRMGSAALDLCSVAAGTADAYVEEGPHLWDWAAAGLVASEAGARVAVLPGASGQDCVVCAPMEGFAEVLDLVSHCGFLGPGTARDERP